MNDKERILTEIIKGLFHNYSGGKDFSPLNYEEDQVHFARYVKWEDLKKGDIVLCSTSDIHDFTIGFVEELLDEKSQDVLVRKMGSDEVCKVQNEMFICIKGLKSYQVLEGEKANFRDKAKKVFSKYVKSNYRFAGVTFEEENKAKIWIRAPFGGYDPKNEKEAVPFPVNIIWDKDITIDGIHEEMVKQGYGTKEYEFIYSGLEKQMKD